MRLILVSLGIFVLHALSGVGYMRQPSNIWYIIYYSGSSGISFFTVYMLPTMVFSYTFAQEWEDHASIYWIQRSGVVRYVVSKWIATAVAGFLAVFLSYCLFIFVLRWFYPVYGFDVSTSPYEALVQRGNGLVGLLYFSLDKGLSGAVIAVFGASMSVVIVSPYAAIVSPLAAFLTLSRIVAAWKLPDVMNPAYWMRTVDIASSAGQALLQKLTISIIVIIGLTILSILLTKRRLRYA